MSKYLDSAGVTILWSKIKELVNSNVTDIQADLEILAQKDISLQNEINNVKTTLNTLTNNPDAVINSFNEIVNFLANIENSETLEGIVNGINKSITDGDTAEADARKKADDDITALIVKLHAVLTLSADKTVIEKGVATDVTLTHSAKFDGANLTYTLQVNGAALANPYSISDKTTFNCVFKIDNSNPKLVTDISKSITVNAYYAKWIGGSTKSTITAADVTTFVKQSITASAAGTYNVTSTDNQYIWFCVPDGMSISKITLGGFAVPNEAPITLSVSGVSYKCYRTTNPLTAGTRSFVVS